MAHKNENPGDVVGTARGAGISESSDSNQPTKLRQAAQGAALVRPKLYRRLVKWLAGRTRMEIRGENENGPIITIAVEDGGQS